MTISFGRINSLVDCLSFFCRYPYRVERLNVLFDWLVGWSCVILTLLKMFLWWIIF